MISCVEWVPEGAADPNPKRFELSKAEMEMLEEQVNMAEEAYKADDANTDASSVEDADDNAASSGLLARLRNVRILVSSIVNEVREKGGRGHG